MPMYRVTRLQTTLHTFNVWRDDALAAEIAVSCGSLPYVVDKEGCDLVSSHECPDVTTVEGAIDELCGNVIPLAPTTAEKMIAPWTDEQVARLNEFQQSGQFHPFTCGGRRGDDAHRIYASLNGGDLGQLVAKNDGWVCPVCSYRQNWAHAWMSLPEV